MSNPGKLIKDLCTEKAMSPAELERKLDLANGTISRWEKGVSPNSGALQKVADYFNVSVDYLLGRTSERNVLDQWNKQQNLKKIKQQIKNIETIAAHLEDVELDDEEAELLELYIKSLVRQKKKKK